MEKKSSKRELFHHDSSPPDGGDSRWTIGIASFLRAGFLIPLFIILLALTFGSAWFDYLGSRRQILHVMGEEAISLAQITARAASNGIAGYQHLQDEIVQRLRLAARQVNLLERTGKISSADLAALADEAAIFRIVIVDSLGRKVAGNHPDDLPEKGEALLKSTLPGFLASGEEYLFLGIQEGGRSDEDRLVLLARRHGGGAILLNIDAVEMLRFRRRMGVDGVMREIGEVPGLAFAVLEDTDGVLALSRQAWDIPFPHQDSFIDSCLQQGVAASRLIHIDSGTGSEAIMEAVAPLRISETEPGLVRVGLHADHLLATRDLFRRNLLLRAALALLLGLTMIALLSVNSSRRLLDREYRRIRADVRRLEEERHIRDKITAMGELARGVAHEIRNPLNTMRMIAQRLSREYKPASDQDGYGELTGVMMGEADRIAGIVDEFLSYARPPQVCLEPGDLRQLVEQQVAGFGPRAEAAGVKLKPDFEPLPRFPFDPELMKQVLLNLMINALEAMPQGGHLGVTLHREGRSAVLEVHDDGDGIAPRTMSRIWDLYFSTKETGTGMGLPTIHRIIQEHRGSVKVDSKPGQGSCFSVRLPLE
jgi:signal transduction histidine kinase